MREKFSPLTDARGVVLLDVDVGVREPLDDVPVVLDPVVGQLLEEDGTIEVVAVVSAQNDLKTDLMRRKMFTF